MSSSPSSAPSGCGKSTLLSSIAGFLQPDSGEITVDGSRVNGPAAGRAVVFQQASLMPWRTVAKNVAYGLTLQKVLSRKDIPARVQAAIATVGLQGYEHHYPHQISGGMQQRVNLARALATQPELLLMDEPFGALDALTKEVLQDELLEIVQKRTSTTIFITHDIDEAVFLGDRVVVMSARPGRIAHVQELPFDRPRDRTLMKSPTFHRHRQRAARDAAPRADLGRFPEGVAGMTTTTVPMGRSPARPGRGRSRLRRPAWIDVRAVSG